MVMDVIKYGYAKDSVVGIECVLVIQTVIVKVVIVLVILSVLETVITALARELIVLVNLLVLVLEVT